MQAGVEAEELVAAVGEEILAEGVAPVHLEHQPAEIAQLVLALPLDDPALAANDAGRRQSAARRGLGAGRAAEQGHGPIESTSSDRSPSTRQTNAVRTPADIEPLHLLDIEVEGGTWPVHAWIVDGRVLVDTGMTDSTPELDAEWPNRLLPWPDVSGVEVVINTHLHFDHCGGNRRFAALPIYVQRVAELGDQSGRLIADITVVRARAGALRRPGRGHDAGRVLATCDAQLRFDGISVVRGVRRRPRCRRRAHERGRVGGDRRRGIDRPQRRRSPRRVDGEVRRLRRREAASSPAPASRSWTAASRAEGRAGPSPLAAVIARSQCVRSGASSAARRGNARCTDHRRRSQPDREAERHARVCTRRRAGGAGAERPDRAPRHRSGRRRGRPDGLRLASRRAGAERRPRRVADRRLAGDGLRDARSTASAVPRCRRR